MVKIKGMNWLEIVLFPDESPVIAPPTQLIDFGNGPEFARRHQNPDGSVGGWVAATAYCAHTVVVGPNACVLGYANVSGYANILDYAKICGRATIMGNTIVSGNAIIKGHSTISGNAIVGGNARIEREARIFGHAIVIDATIGGRARIFGNAKINTGRINTTQWLFGDDLRALRAYDCKTHRFRLTAKRLGMENLLIEKFVQANDKGVPFAQLATILTTAPMPRSTNVPKKERLRIAYETLALLDKAIGHSS